ncbi:MAG: NUDIX domain-containing protein, partial [Sphingomicrobium sp.]
GYYARARNLVACARAVAAMGGFPTSVAELRRLPGIGAYTSAAIAAIAFGEPAGAVDTNVERVLSRFYAIAEPRRGDLEQRMVAIVSTGPAGDLVQAMIDLGATICLPRAPRCESCPLRAGCRAFAEGRPVAFPRPKARKVRPQRFGTAWWIERDGAIWLVRRPSRGLLGGMASLPGSEWSNESRPDGHPIASVRHVFTHFSLDLYIVAASEPLNDGWWQSLEAISEAGLPTLYRRAVEAVLTRRLAAPECDTGARLEVAQAGP